MSEMKPVRSSNIKAVGYDPERAILSVQFHGDETKGTPPRTYHHFGVSAEDHVALLGEGVEGHSVGRHYSKFIRGKFQHRMEEPE